MRRSPADSTNRSLAALGKLQHIPIINRLGSRIEVTVRLRRHTAA